MDFTSDEFEGLKNSDKVMLNCSGCGEAFAITFGELKRRVGKKQPIRLFCTPNCRETKPYAPIQTRKYDSYGRILTPTYLDDDMDNLEYLRQ